MTKTSEDEPVFVADSSIGKLPDHILIEIFIRVPISEWAQISCVKKHWASIFCGECLWQAALLRYYPSANYSKRWPGPIPRGSSKRYVLLLKETVLIPGDYIGFLKKLSIVKIICMVKR